MNGQRQPITDSMITDYMQHREQGSYSPAASFDRRGIASYQPHHPPSSLYANSMNAN